MNVKIDLKILNDEIIEYQKSKNQRLASIIFEKLLFLTRNVLSSRYYGMKKQLSYTDIDDVVYHTATALLMRISLNDNYTHNYWITAIDNELKNHLPQYQLNKKVKQIGSELGEVYKSIKNAVSLDEYLEYNLYKEEEEE